MMSEAEGVSPDREVLTAESERGRRAIAAVMKRAYQAEIEAVPPRWARVLLADREPVSFILVDPNCWMEQPGRPLRFAFIRDVATRDDRRGNGHFRFLMEHTFAALRAESIPLVLTHGSHLLYRRFGFDVFTHHCGLFIRPEQVEQSLGTVQLPAAGAQELLTVEEDRAFFQADLMLVSEVRAETVTQGVAVLRAAAVLARRRSRARILFEHPSAPSYGSAYPVHSMLVTPFTALALSCGAELRVQQADPESGPILDADWIKVLDAPLLLEHVLHGGQPDQPLARAAVAFETDAGNVTIVGDGMDVGVQAERLPRAAALAWPSAALAQLVTGFREAALLCALHRTPAEAQTLQLLDRLFPRRWRLSRNENWTYK